MADIRIKWKRDAMYELRRAPKVVDFLEEMGTQLCEEANQTLPENVGYRMSSGQGRRNPQGRWAVRVYTSSNHAKRSDAIHNTLVRILGAK